MLKCIKNIEELMDTDKIVIDLTRLKTYPISKRRSKVQKENFARPPKKEASFLEFYDSLPKILAGNDFRAVVDAIVRSYKRKKSIIFVMGSHVIKCGLNPIIIELLKKGVVSLVALNGSGAIHDFEIALIGKTSEDVEEGLLDGSFGMARETALYINGAASEAVEKSIGMGEAIARVIEEEKLPFRNLSVAYNCLKEGISITIHVAIGTDIIHQHPSCDGSTLGEASLRDFHIFIDEVCRLEGGVIINFGSNVILPEVFLKALNVARNLGYKVADFTACNFDIIFHYRPYQNVVRRPTSLGGKGYNIIGHHEILIPLLAQAVLEQL